MAHSKRLITLLSLTISSFLLVSNTAKEEGNQRVAGKSELKQTRKGKAIAPVIDIQPQLRRMHDVDSVRAEIQAIKKLGFDRVYMVLCNPGYPAFSDPGIVPVPLDKKTGNRTLESILKLGDPNWVYLNEAKKAGLQAWAIIKPYESGTGSTIPHGAKAPMSLAQIETIGGQHVYFDNLLSKKPELRVMRKPLPDSILARLNEPVQELEIAFCLDAFTNKTAADQFFKYEGIKDSEVEIPEIGLWTSRENGQYQKLEDGFKVQTKIEQRSVSDGNNNLISSAKRHLVISIKGLNITKEYPYMAVTLEKGGRFYTIPYSMIKAYSGSGEIPVTISLHSRATMSAVEQNNPYREREWGLEKHPVMGDVAKKSFADWGFEFEWHGAGFWGDGWMNNPVYGIARGKRTHMKGTLCEAYPEVRNYWLDQVKRAVDMGFDGVDIRLQNHSGMVTDYTNYGYNEPIVKKYRELYGVDILKEKADPLKIMKIRGDYFYSFLVEAAAVIHRKGKKIQVHLRHAHEAPLLSDDFNELGFWAMPKILLDWKKIVDLADEITLKHYYHNNYRTVLGSQIKQYAKRQNKRVWVHAYIQQGKELNTGFFREVEKDDLIGGILLYEFEDSIYKADPSDMNPDVPSLGSVARLLREFDYK